MVRVVMLWVLAHERATVDHLGLIPSFLSDADARGAVEQFRQNYPGGWDSFKGPSIGDDFSLHYPGDPALPLLAYTQLHDEHVFVYDRAWVAVIDGAGNVDFARLD